MKQTILRHYSFGVMVFLLTFFGCTKKGVIPNEQTEIATGDKGAAPAPPGICLYTIFHTLESGTVVSISTHNKGEVNKHLKHGDTYTTSCN